MRFFKEIFEDISGIGQCPKRPKLKSQIKILGNQNLSNFILKQ
ncbi:MAG: hypothetical protein O8C66_11925 [Candidatus Methanoperedens sp.]|nr:hypothetical protein [Candidatus Methanoperedens sp.]MCZ7371210.1 hypothetical protein [Candidatus Methanoperedens sp.]